MLLIELAMAPQIHERVGGQSERALDGIGRIQRK